MQLHKRTVEVRETWIEIYHLPEMELVTAIEILSPMSQGRVRPFGLSGQAQWVDRSTGQSCRDRLAPERRADADLGDLAAGRLRRHRGARRSAARRPRSTPGRCGTPSGPAHRGSALPDPDIPLDLGEAFRMTFDRGGYARVMRYSRPLPESLRISPEDRQWAENLGR